MIRTEKASCKHLTHKYPAYYGCTIEEVSVIAIIFLIINLIFSAILALVVGKFFLIFIITFVISYFLIRFSAQKIGEIKANKQQGYILLKLKQWMNIKVGFSIPFITRTGAWSTRRSI